jgi:hypothetical protein
MHPAPLPRGIEQLGDGGLEPLGFDPLPSSLRTAGPAVIFDVIVWR